MVQAQRVERAFRELVETMARLRGPDGCPWDRAQTPQDLRNYVLEEAYELIQAVTEGEPAAVRDELGDLLLQVVFLARIFEEQGHFTIADVAEHLRAKLVHRHPHVFGNETARTPEEVLQNWEDRKARERGHRRVSDRLRAVPRYLPALAEAWQIQRKVAQVGFDWPSWEGALDKAREELQEVRQAAQEDADRVVDEIGDLLFAVVNLARKLNVNPEMALKRANARFVQRFAAVEQRLAEQGQRPEDVDLETLDRIWEAIKQDPGTAG